MTTADRSNALMPAPHARLLIAAVAGLAAVPLAMLATPKVGLRVLAAWDVAAGVYLALLWRMFLRTEIETIKARAANQDERQAVIFVIVLLALAASLGAVLYALIDSRTAPPPQKAAAGVLVTATLALGWAVLQAVFVPHYAHRHFSEITRGKTYGVNFKGEQPSSYLDFVYLAFTVSATYQVSDNEIGSTSLRNLITAHGAAAFVYNTALLALGISTLAGFFN